MVNKNQLKIGAILSYLNILLSIAIGFVTTPLLIHNLGNSEYGAYQMTAALIGYISVLDLGLHNAVTRYVARYLATGDKRNEENFLAISIGIFAFVGLLILVVVTIVYANVPNIYRHKATSNEIEIIKKLLPVLGINLAVSMPGAVFSSVITAYERFVFSRTCATIKLIARFVMLVILMQIGGKAFGVVLIDFTLNLIVILIETYYCFKKLHIRIKLYEVEKTYIVSVFSFSIYVFIASITDQINWKADTTILGIMMGTTAVTFYSIAGALISYYRSFSGAVSGIFLPKATKMTVSGATNSELTDLMIKVGRIQLIVIGLILSGFAVIGKEFIVLWVGTEFAQAYFWFFIMAIPLLVPMTQSIGINILEAKFKHKFRALVYFGIAIANIGLTVFLVQSYEITGAAVGTGVAMLVGNNLIINIYYAKVIGLEIGRFFKEVYFSILPFQLIITATFIILDRVIAVSGNWGDLILKGIIICLGYCVIIYTFVMTKNEKQSIKLNM